MDKFRTAGYKTLVPAKPYAKALKKAPSTNYSLKKDWLHLLDSHFFTESYPKELMNAISAPDKRMTMYVKELL